MFSQFINQLNHTSANDKLSLLFSTTAALPHTAILARSNKHAAIGDLDLQSLFTEAGYALEVLVEDTKTVRLDLTKQQFVDLAVLYRQKIMALLQALQAAAERDNELENSLLALHQSLEVYEKHVTQKQTQTAPEHAPNVTPNIRNHFRQPYLADDGFPIVDKTSWPANRNKQRYLQLHYPKLFRNRNEDALQLTLDTLPPHHIIMDAGIGDGNALAQLKTRDNTTIGFTLHEIDPKNTPLIDGLCYSPIPDGKEARAAFAVLRGQVHQLTCTYGPSTYATNPIHALIFLALLLKEGATANIIISSVFGEHVDQSPIGYANTREQLIAFFKHELDLEMTSARTFINSAVEKGAICKDFCITLHRRFNAKVRTESLDELFALADRILGQPHTIPKTTDRGTFKHGFKIEGKAYSLTKSVNMQPYHWQAAVSVMHMDYVLQDGIGVRVHLQFNEPTSRQYFNTQFNEFFIAHPNRDWQLTANSNEPCTTITYYDKETDERVIQHSYSQADGGWSCVYNHQSNLAHDTLTLPTFTANDVSYCVKQARVQLQTAMDIPGVDHMDENQLVAEKTTVAIYQRDTSHPAVLFKMPDTRREVDRLKNQYVLGQKNSL
jgi:hypothetical protein